MRRWCSSFICIASSVLAVGMPQAQADLSVMSQLLKQTPTTAGFDICHGGGCAKVSHAMLTDAEWQLVLVQFQPRAYDAQTERAQLAQAIAVLELEVGAKTGTAGDRGGTFGNSAYTGQMDCNDEATNTTTYLKLMQSAGLMRFHTLQDTKTRGVYLNRWPHTTAVIREHETGQEFAVDAWFYDNGNPPVILPLQQWKAGWMPADSPAQ